MPNFVTLSCPTCGGKLEITNEIERFACGYCGNEHVVKRSGGIVAIAAVVEKLVEIKSGVDKTASELAIKRLEQEIASIEHILLYAKANKNFLIYHVEEYGEHGFDLRVAGSALVEIEEPDAEIRSLKQILKGKPLKGEGDRILNVYRNLTPERATLLVEIISGNFINPVDEKTHPNAYSKIEECREYMLNGQKSTDPFVRIGTRKVIEKIQKVGSEDELRRQVIEKTQELAKHRKIVDS